jgi:hypothetical protein
MSPTQRRAAATPQLNDNQIAQRAYERWQARGCPQTDGREDWYAAEAELRTEQVPRRRRILRSALRRLGI